MKILPSYISSVFQNFESYLRTDLIWLKMILGWF